MDLHSNADPSGSGVDRQVILRWMFNLRQVVAFGIFVVALLSPDASDLWRGIMASIPVVTSVVVTAVLIRWTELRGEAVTARFLYAQIIHDFLLLTEFLDFARVPHARLGRIDIRGAVTGAVNDTVGGPTGVYAPPRAPR